MIPLDELYIGTRYFNDYYGIKKKAHHSYKNYLRHSLPYAVYKAGGELYRAGSSLYHTYSGGASKRKSHPRPDRKLTEYYTRSKARKTGNQENNINMPPVERMEVEGGTASASNLVSNILQDVGGTVGSGKGTFSKLCIYVGRQHRLRHRKAKSKIKYYHSYCFNMFKTTKAGYDQWYNCGSLLNYTQLFNETSTAPGVATSRVGFSDTKVSLYGLAEPGYSAGTFGPPVGAGGGTGEVSTVGAPFNSTVPPSGAFYIENVYGALNMTNYTQIQQEVTLYWVVLKRPIYPGTNNNSGPLQDWSTTGQFYYKQTNVDSTGYTLAANPSYGAETMVVTDAPTYYMNPGSNWLYTTYMKKNWKVLKSSTHVLQPGFNHKLDYDIKIHKYIDLEKAWQEWRAQNSDMSAFPHLTVHLIARARPAPVFNSTKGQMMPGPADVRVWGYHTFRLHYVEAPEQIKTIKYVDPGVLAITPVITTAPLYDDLKIPAPGTGIEGQLTQNP